MVSMPYHVSKSRFEELVEQALERLPPRFAEFLEEVPVEIRPRSTPTMRRKAGIDPDHLLLGLYHGRPLTQRSVEDSGRLPDVIYIFQEDVEQSCNSEEELVEQVRITVLHEIGHLFGLSEDDLDQLG
jgi:predicted Zn-dependent protease with MMP-like domain